MFPAWSPELKTHSNFLLLEKIQPAVQYPTYAHENPDTHFPNILGTLNLTEFESKAWEYSRAQRVRPPKSATNYSTPIGREVATGGQSNANPQMKTFGVNVPLSVPR